MSNKICKRLIFILAFFSFCIFLIMLFVLKNYGNNIIIAQAKVDVAPKFLNSLIDNNKLMLCYEYDHDGEVSSINTDYNATIKSTNYTIPYIYGYSIIKGCFFAKTNESLNSNVVVLNKKSAFEIFGSYDVIDNHLECNNLKYTVIGVIDDDDKIHKNIYMPLNSKNNFPNIISIKVDNEKSNSIDYINKILNKDSNTDNFNYFNLSELSKIPKGILLESIYLLLLILCELLTFKAFSFFCKSIKKLRLSLKMHYINELFIKNTGIIIKFIISALLFILPLAMIIFIIDLSIKNLFVLLPKFDLLLKYTNDILIGNTIYKTDIFISIFFLIIITSTLFIAIFKTKYFT